MKHTRVIVFEGPDETGKSTQVYNVASALEYKGKSVYTLKYPLYDGLVGDSILGCLKNGVDNVIEMKLSERGCVSTGVMFSLMQSINKFFGMNQLYNLAKFGHFDYILVDRYLMSSYVYDVARSRISNNSEDEHLVNSINDAVDSFIRYFQKEYDFPSFEYIVFKPSENIKNLTIAKKREQDNFDKDTKLKSEVIKCFDEFTKRDIITKNGGVLFDVIYTVDTDKILGYIYSVAEWDHSSLHATEILNKVTTAIANEILDGDDDKISPSYNYTYS